MPWPPALRPWRSNVSVELATAQPLFVPPMTQESGTRASDMNTSLNSALPVISRSGRTSTAPSWCMSKANHVMPWCFGASGLVRATSIPMSAMWPPDVQTFWPLTIHSSPSRTARVPRPARSEPAPGSLNSWHHARCPVTIGRTSSSICSGVPCLAIVGAARAMPSPAGGPSAPRSAMRADTASASGRDTPLP